MNNNDNQQSLESMPFTEWGERPGGYLITPLEEPGKIRKLTPEDNIAVAACVLLNGSITSAEYKVGLECKIRTAPEVLSEAAVQTMMDGYNKIVGSLQEEPLNPGLEDFKAKTLQEEGIAELKNNHSLLGGLAVYDSSEGYKTGLFVSRGFTSLSNNNAINVGLEARSPGAAANVKEMAGALYKQNDRRALAPQALDLVMKALIAGGLPEENEMQTELGIASGQPQTANQAERTPDASAAMA